MPEAEVRALAFFSLVVTIVSLISMNRSFGASLVAAFGRPNPALVLVLFVVASILGLTVLWPVVRDLFRFGPLHGDDIAATVAAGAGALIILELLKPVVRKWN
jgi:P-type Ca2+ transporter type 2C